MNTSRIIISLPTSDLRRAFTFYRDGLGLSLATPGDGMPEPVVFALNTGAHLMIVPRDGFSWVLGGNKVADPGVSECVVGLHAETRAEVDAFAERAEKAGATVNAAPAEKPWGYSASFLDLDGHLWLMVAPPGAR